MMVVVRLMLLLGFVSSFVFFASFSTFFVMLSEYSFVENYISELGAVGSPVRFFANLLGFFIPGLLFASFGIGVYYFFSRSVIGSATGILVVVAGICFTLISFFPCDLMCVNYSSTGWWHEFLSDSSLYIGIMSIIFFLFSPTSHRNASIAHGLRMWIVAALVAVALGSTLFYLYSGSSASALFQKLAVGILFLLMGGLSLYFFRQSHALAPVRYISKPQMYGLLLGLLVSVSVMGIVSVL